MRIRTLAAAGTTAALLFALTACNDDDSSDADSPKPPASTSSAPAPDEDEAESQAQALSAATFKEAVERAQSKKDGRTGHMDATFDLTVSGQSATMTMSSDFASGDKPEDAMMDATIDVAGERMKLRLVDEILYLNAPAMSMSSGRPWVSVDTNDTDSPFGSMFESASPQSFTDFLAGAKNLEDLGSESVDGVETTHYELTVSTKQLLAGNEQLSSLAPQAAGMPKKLKINVWLNSDQLPVQLKVPFAKMGSFEMHFSDYGQQVDVKAPPANLVSEMGAASL